MRLALMIKKTKKRKEIHINIIIININNFQFKIFNKQLKNCQIKINQVLLKIQQMIKISEIYHQIF